MKLKFFQLFVISFVSITVFVGCPILDNTISGDQNIKIQIDQTKLENGTYTFTFPDSAVVDGRGNVASSELVVTIHNEGEKKLTIESVQLSLGSSEDFIIDLTDSDMAIDSQAFTTFSVFYDPETSLDVQTAEVVITTDDPDESIFTFSLIGKGILRILPAVESPLEFGSAVKASESIVIVGSGNNAFIYYKDSSDEIWLEEKKLTISNPSNFADTIGIDTDNAIISNDGEDRVYIFYKDYGGLDNWGSPIPESIFGGSNSGFGRSLAIENSTLIVGAPRAYVDGIYAQGYVRVFSKVSQTWGYDKEINASDGGIQDFFGISCDLSEDTIIVGSGDEKVYFYEKDFGGTNNWGEIRKVSNTDVGLLTGNFGFYVTLSGDTAATSSVETQKGLEHITILSRNEGGENNWGLSHIIERSDVHGSSKLILSEDLLVASYSKIVDLYSRNEGGLNAWGHLERIYVCNADPDNPYEKEPFGDSIEITDDYIYIGGIDWAGDHSSICQGALYVWKR